MAKQARTNESLGENPIVAKLLAEAGPDVRAYRGYVGPGGRDGYVTLYPSLADLTKSFEIGEDDIVHSEVIPEAFAPFGAVMVWVRAGGDMAARSMTTANREAAKKNVGAGARSADRLQMKRQAATYASDDSCTSNCDCVSNCDPCISICRWTCETRMQEQ